MDEKETEGEGERERKLASTPPRAEEKDSFARLINQCQSATLNDVCQRKIAPLPAREDLPNRLGELPGSNGMPKTTTTAIDGKCHKTTNDGNAFSLSLSLSFLFSFLLLSGHSFTRSTSNRKFFIHSTADVLIKLNRRRRRN